MSADDTGNRSAGDAGGGTAVASRNVEKTPEGNDKAPRRVSKKCSGQGVSQQCSDACAPITQYKAVSYRQPAKT